MRLGVDSIPNDPAWGGRAGPLAAGVLVLDEGLASNLLAGRSLSVGNPTFFHRGSFFLLPANDAIRDPADHPIAFFWARMGRRLTALARTPVTATAGGRL